MFKPNSNSSSFRGQKEEGSILLYTVLILSIILAISITLAAIFLPKVKNISEAGSNSINALYAADSAIEWCIYTNNSKPALPKPVMANGATYVITADPTCVTKPLNYQAVGKYRGVSRALEVTQ